MCAGNAEHGRATAQKRVLLRASVTGPAAAGRAAQVDAIGCNTGRNVQTKEQRESGMNAGAGDTNMGAIDLVERKKEERKIKFNSFLQGYFND